MKDYSTQWIKTIARRVRWRRLAAVIILVSAPVWGWVQRTECIDSIIYRGGLSQDVGRSVDYAFTVCDSGYFWSLTGAAALTLLLLWAIVEFARFFVLILFPKFFMRSEGGILKEDADSR